MKRLRAALAASFVLWSLFAVFGLKPDHLCLGSSRCDVPAQIDSTILALNRGWDVYRLPSARLGPRSGSEQARVLSARYGWPSDGVTDLIDIPERAGKPPLMLNWSYLPRPYPPGVFLYFLPEALLKEYAGWSPKAASALALVQLLLAAHVLVWLFGSALLAEAPDEAARALAAWIILPLIYLEAVAWALRGFYDAIALIPLLLCARALRGRRPVPALAWFAASLFLHFRTLWYLPVAAWALRQACRRPAKSPWLAAGAAALVAASAAAFAALYPWLMTLQPTNFFFLTAQPESWLRLAYLLVPLGLLAAPLARGRAWLPLACLGWTVVMLVRSPFVQFWHSFYLTPLFAFTDLGERSPGQTRALLLLAYLVLASLAFTYFCFNGLLIQDALKELLG